MQRYKQHIMNKYGTYLGYNSACNRNIPYPARTPIEANNYGKYESYWTVARSSHAEYLHTIANNRHDTSMFAMFGNCRFLRTLFKPLP